MVDKWLFLNLSFQSTSECKKKKKKQTRNNHQTVNIDIIGVNIVLRD